MLFVQGHPEERSGTTPAARRATIAFALVALGEVAALGFWRAGWSAPSAGWFGLALLALAFVAACRNDRLSLGALGAACLLLSSGHFTARVLEGSRRGLEFALPTQLEPGAGAIVTLVGILLEEPRELQSSGALAAFLPRGAPVSIALRAQSAMSEAGPRAVTGRVRMLVRGGAPGAKPGDRVRVTGVARAIEGPSNPGEPDARLWSRQDGAACRLEVASPDLIEPLEGERSVGARVDRAWLRARAWLRTRATGVLGAADDRPGRAMLGALLLGESDTGEVRSAFARQGLAHVLAISGFHLAVMAGAALFAVRLTGERGRLEPCIVALLVVLYVVILPTRAPILRAAAMVLAFLGAEAMGRRYDRRALLAWIAIGVLILRPMDLFSLGYQLTFGITAALVWFGERVHQRLFPPALTFARREPPDVLERRWWMDGATRLVSASLLCWLVATPLVARTTGLVSPTAVLSTLLIVPLVTVLLWAGYAVLVVGMLAPPAGAWATQALDGLAGVLLVVVRAFDASPGTTLYAPRLSIPLVVALTALALWWLVRGRARSPGIWAATILALGWLGGEVATAGRLDYQDLLRLDTLDVGDGTCHVVRSGRDALLWDCGSLDPSIGLRTIPRALRDLGVWRIRDAVVTHPNFDHYCALPDIAERIGLERVHVSRAFLDRADREPGGAAAALVQNLAAHGVEVRVLHTGDALDLGATRLEVLSPQEGAAFRADNDHSLVAMLRVPTAAGERRVLLCGDIQREAMAALMAPRADLAADVLELPHHGSVHPMALDFVERVDPRIVLQSTGPSRAMDIRWNVQRRGRAWWTTATDGAAWVEVRRDGRVVTGSDGRPHAPATGSPARGDGAHAPTGAPAGASGRVGQG